MPHRKRMVAKESRGSRRSLVRKHGRKYEHLYRHLNVSGPRSRVATGGKQ